MPLSEEHFTEIGRDFVDCILHNLKAEFGETVKGFIIEDNVIHIDVPDTIDEKTLKEIREKLVNFRLFKDVTVN